MVISRLNNKGFTLVEMMCAIVVSLLGIFAMLKSMETITHSNVKNQLRDVAVKIADEKMKTMQDSPFVENIVHIPYSTVFRDSRAYTVRKSLNQVSNDTRELVVKVSWAYKNISSHHEVRSLKSR